MSKSTNTNTPFCKVCFDAGKSIAEYTSHYVRKTPALDSPVVCPTILAQSCRACGKGGHTVGYCPEVAKQKKQEQKEANMKAYRAEKERKEATKQVKPVTTNQNLFATLLDSDSDSEAKERRHAKKQLKRQQKEQQKQEQKQVKQEQKQEKQELVSTSEFPALSSKAVTQPVFATSYAIALQKKYPDVKAEAAVKAEEPVIKFYYREREPLNASTMDWAATEEDSDDEW